MIVDIRSASMCILYPLFDNQGKNRNFRFGVVVSDFADFRNSKMGTISKN